MGDYVRGILPAVVIQLVEHFNNDPKMEDSGPVVARMGRSWIRWWELSGLSSLIMFNIYGLPSTSIPTCICLLSKISTCPNRLISSLSASQVFPVDLMADSPFKLVSIFNLFGNKVFLNDNRYFSLVLPLALQLSLLETSYLSWTFYVRLWGNLWRSDTEHEDIQQNDT